MEIPQHITLSDLETLLTESISLSDTDRKQINANRNYLEQKLKTGQTFYGINTGFGSLCNVRVTDEELSLLQENLVCSHACGMGDEVPQHIVKLMLLLKIKNMAQGYSGVKEATVQRFVDFYNKNILPVVFEQGSLGASGDLAPLAHLSLPLLGKGSVYFDNKKVDAQQALSASGLEAMQLHAKEGLALLNGTQFMSAYGSWALLKAKKLLRWADVIMALSLEAYDCKADPFTEGIHRVRPHKGQQDTAQAIRDLLTKSELQAQHKVQVQDPYSFRCVPQVHGASKDAIAYVAQVVETEINAVTDNPLVFEEEDMIVSGGNFHGQPLALSLDFLAMALAELANISERRTYLLVSGQRGLPPFLAKDAGLHSGFMIAQYTAAAIVSQNKQYCTPASVDSIVSSNGQEDHVSMGANAATKLKKVVDNVQRVLAIELLCAAQALDFRRPAKTSIALEKVYAAFRKIVTFNDADRVLHDDLIAAEQFLNQDCDALMK